MLDLLLFANLVISLTQKSLLMHIFTRLSISLNLNVSHAEDVVLEPNVVIKICVLEETLDHPVQNVLFQIQLTKIMMISPIAWISITKPVQARTVLMHV